MTFFVFASLGFGDIGGVCSASIGALFGYFGGIHRVQALRFGDIMIPNNERIKRRRQWRMKWKLRISWAYEGILQKQDAVVLLIWFYMI